MISRSSVGGDAPANFGRHRDPGTARPDRWNERGVLAPTRGISVSSQRSRAPDDKDRQVVVSVRFPNHLLEQIQAMAIVLSFTANAVIRDGTEAYVREQAASPEQC